MASRILPDLIAQQVLFYIHKIHVNPKISIQELRLLTLPFLDFNGQNQQGEMIVHASIATEVEAIFKELLEAKFPIEKVKLIEEYKASDDASMEDNNTSCFCYREAVQKPGVLSKHSFGLAIDVNPLYNPYIKKELILPTQGKKFVDRSQNHPGMIHKNGICHQAFLKRGWIWGGEWEDRQDLHHFEKN